MQYGFVINQETCIGCHACTTACKAENDVPVGSFRTNVKYVEIGKFPEVKRSFLVQRCNHCTDAPCVTICPVNALTKRKDGIVDIDREACIGCRACMQACPYDALYLNEDLGAVEKCHFCAHRVEKGLQPACVTVCPVGAIIPGDFDDPQSEVSLIRMAQVTLARRPEQGTGPNVLYVGANQVALTPGQAEKPRSYIWSQRRDTKPEDWPQEVGTEPDAREVLNADHKVEWGWPVALYLLTKGIAGGAAMIAPFLWMFGGVGLLPGMNDESWLSGLPHPAPVGIAPWWAPEGIGLLFMLITVFLLIEDLKRPLHFYKLFTRPNWNSWLVKGGIVLTVFGVLSAGIILAGMMKMDPGLIMGLRWANAAVGALVSGYTAFLFKQCKGRDLWEADGLIWHLLAQSVTAGAAFFLLIGVGNVVVITAFAVGAAVLAGLHLMPLKPKVQTDNYRQAVGFLEGARLGKFHIAKVAGPLFLFLIPLFGATLNSSVLLPQILPAAFVLTLLFLYERAFVRAGQLPPLS